MTCAHSDAFELNLASWCRRCGALRVDRSKQRGDGRLATVNGEWRLPVKPSDHAYPVNATNVI